MSDRPKRWFGVATPGEPSTPALKHYALLAWRLVSNAVESFLENNDLLRAAALTYTVALSIVPILALAFSVLKGFGGAAEVRELVRKHLAPGSSGLGDQLMHFVGNVNAAALGTVGGVFLLLTVISTMGTIEQALNTIFRVPRSRSYLRKFSDYLSVLFTVPLLMAAALALTTASSTHLVALPGVAYLTPTLFAWTGFFFLFTFFPYTNVSYTAAAAGSLATAIMFQVAQWGYVRFQVGAAKYHAIYGALATVPIFLVWIYTAWAIVLFGAELTAAMQRGIEPPPLHPRSPDFALAAAIHVLLRLADRMRDDAGTITLSGLARELGVGQSALLPVVAKLKSAGLIVESASEARGRAAGLYLVREPAAIALGDALAPFLDSGSGAQPDPRAAIAMSRLAAARSAALNSLTLGDLLDESAARANAPADNPAAARVIK